MKTTVFPAIIINQTTGFGRSGYIYIYIHITNIKGKKRFTILSWLFFVVTLQGLSENGFTQLH
jgi:hypothetical protein